MTCGKCETCVCKNTFKQNSNKFSSFQTMLSKLFEKFEYNSVYQVVSKLEDTDYFIINYNYDDDLYEIRPHYEFFDYSEIVERMDNESTGNVFDEHGRLIASFQLIYKDGKWCREYNFEYKLMDYKKSGLFTGPENSVDANIKDYKLKRLISRYISIIENEGVTKEVKHEYGSCNLEHLLWMLKNIYPKRNRSMLERYMFLGYIQGVLRSKNLIDVRHERDIMHELV